MSAPNLPRAGLPKIPPAVIDAFWIYFSTHQDQVVLSVYHGFVKIRLGQLRPVFEALFGNTPQQ